MVLGAQRADHLMGQGWSGRNLPMESGNLESDRQTDRRTVSRQSCNCESLIQQVILGLKPNPEVLELLLTLIVAMPLHSLPYLHVHNMAL